MRCRLGGAVIPSTEQKLLALHPTHEEYVGKYTQAAGKALAAGYLVQADYDAAIWKAQGAPIPK